MITPKTFKYDQIWKKGETVITVNSIFRDKRQANVERCSGKSCNSESISIDRLIKEGFTLAGRKKRIKFKALDEIKSILRIFE